MVGKKGRPPNPEAKRQLRAEKARRLLKVELAKPRPNGRMPGLKEAVSSVADGLGVSTRTVERWLATPPPTAEENWLFTASMMTRYEIDARIDKLHPNASPQEKTPWRKQYLEELSRETPAQRWRRLSEE